MNNEELKEFINSKREPITSCKDLTKHFIGIHKTIPVYLTPSFEKEFNYKITKLGELQQENQELNKENDKLTAKLNKNKILQNEFIEWLESEIKECKDAEEKYADGDDNSYYNNNELRIEILSKYKEIIGGKDE